ncbi:hypothetical protein DEU56DRAFT_835029 [Suillus clintonianus]|uniref:uncharacterized protein n=1 Tax=Suillus clintonianus TaxID=1904413 RepID=UPI001B868F69|nr:uncharacterized protein DEU56DRAFT_835029 [Suillus clintonianus]KAG2121245.1 hypothetical protein DEU56DRAFT_835029 [Suillus clintonianus]
MSEESILDTILEEILQAHLSSPDDSSYKSAKAKLAQQRRPKNSRLVKVLNYEKLVLVLALVLLPLGPHFCGRQEFSIVWLGKSIDTVMGLYIRFIASQADIMKKLASGDDFPDYTTVNTVLQQAGDDSPEGAEARKQIGLWKTQITNSQDSTDLAVFNDVFDKIDAYAEKVFEHLHSDIGEKTDAYLNALDDYRHDVVKFLRTKWLEGSNDPTELNDITRRYDRITARVAVWLSPYDDASKAPIPLLSAWLLDYAWSSLDAVKEGVTEICRWFEPLLDYYHLLHGRGHDMDDRSEVMLQNVVNHAPDAEVQLCRLIWGHRNTLIFHLHNTMSTISEKEIQQDRPKDRTQVDNAFDKLPGAEKQAFRNLLALMKDCLKADLDLCSRGVRGTYAMHITRWDWRSKALWKNAKRDLEPLTKAIFLELRKAGTYRAAILEDSITASLRKQLEDVLGRTRKPIYARWKWWDDIEIPEDITPAVSANIDETFKSKLQQTQLCNILGQRDHNAIKDLVAYVENMVCAHATTAKDSPLNSEVADALNILVSVLRSNSTQLHKCTTAGNPELSCNVKTAVHLKNSKVEDQVDANTRLVHVPRIARPPKRPGAPTVSGWPKKRKRARTSLSEISLSSSSSDEDEDDEDIDALAI